jgi:hypothetical protein
MLVRVYRESWRKLLNHLDFRYVVHRVVLTFAGVGIIWRLGLERYVSCLVMIGEY